MCVLRDVAGLRGDFHAGNVTLLDSGEQLARPFIATQQHRNESSPEIRRVIAPLFQNVFRDCWTWNPRESFNYDIEQS